MNDIVQMIPIASIRILNPRHRDPKKFQLIVESIKNLGLKKPIKVSLRGPDEGNESGYDLVAGQGRIEACKVLGYRDIAAIVVDISKEDRLLMSLVENLARRFSSPMDLIVEIQRLKAQGYSNAAIGRKLDMSDTVVGGLLALMNSGEERLLEAAMLNKIPLGVAVDIAKAEGVEAQRELLKAYETGQVNQVSIRTLRRLMEQRRLFGKSRTPGKNKQTQTTAAGLVNAYKREIERQSDFIRRARQYEGRLIFLVSALRKLVGDKNFIDLLKSEELSTMPQYLGDRIAL